MCWRRTLQVLAEAGRFFEMRYNTSKARPERFERSTYGLEVRCSIQLSYGRNWNFAGIKLQFYWQNFKKIYKAFSDSPALILDHPNNSYLINAESSAVRKEPNTCKKCAFIG
jgi:hypothetical protein